MDAPIHDAHDLSTEETLDTNTLGFTKDGKIADNSCDNLVSILCNKDEPPTKQIHCANSFRASTSPIDKSDSCINLCNGSFDNVVDCKTDDDGLLLC